MEWLPGRPVSIQAEEWRKYYNDNQYRFYVGFGRKQNILQSTAGKNTNNSSLHSHDKFASFDAKQTTKTLLR